MAVPKHLKRIKCKCGKQATEGTVFCKDCKVTVMQKNLKLANRYSSIIAKKHGSNIFQDNPSLMTPQLRWES